MPETTTQTVPLHALDAANLPTFDQANRLAKAGADDNLVRAYQAAAALRAYVEATDMEPFDPTVDQVEPFLADFMHMLDALRVAAVVDQQLAAENGDDDSEIEPHRFEWETVVERARIHYDAERAGR